MQVSHLVGDSPMLLNVSLTTPLPTRYFRSSTSNVLRSRSLRVKNKIVKIKMILSKYYLSLTPPPPLHLSLSTSLMPTHHKDVSIYLEISHKFISKEHVSICAKRRFLITLRCMVFGTLFCVSYPDTSFGFP